MVSFVNYLNQAFVFISFYSIFSNDPERWMTFFSKGTKIDILNRNWTEQTWLWGMPVPTSTSFFGGTGSGPSTPKDALGFLTASEPIHAVAFNPFEWSASLVAFGGKKSIVGKSLKKGGGRNFILYILLYALPTLSRNTHLPISLPGLHMISWGSEIGRRGRVR